MTTGLPRPLTAARMDVEGGEDDAVQAVVEGDVDGDGPWPSDDQVEDYPRRKHPPVLCKLKLNLY